MKLHDFGSLPQAWTRPDRATHLDLIALRRADPRLGFDSYSDDLTFSAFAEAKPAFWNVHSHSQASFSSLADLANTDGLEVALEGVMRLAIDRGFTQASMQKAFLARLVPANEKAVELLAEHMEAL